MDFGSEDCYIISDSESSLSDASIGSGYFSDDVDSEIEARLYSCIHHYSSLDNSNFYSDSFPQNDIIIEENLTDVEQTQYLTNQITSKISNPSLLQKSNCDNSSSESQRLREIKEVRSAPGEFYIDPDTDDYNSGDELLDDPECWKVCVKDLMKDERGRYYRKEKYCERCRKFCHHTIALCPLPKKIVCHYCVNNHHVSKCSIFCNTCGFEHHPLKCRQKYKLHCKICNYLGHKEMHCPLHWKKYANTTMPHEIPLNNRESLNTRKSCPNCAASHYAFECKESFIDDRIRPISPFISDYFKSDHVFGPENVKLPADQSIINKRKKRRKKKKVFMRSYANILVRKGNNGLKKKSKEIKRLNNLDLFGKLKKSLEDEITEARSKNDRKRVKKLTLRKTKVIEIMKEIRKEKSLVDHYQKKKKSFKNKDNKQNLTSLKLSSKN